LQVGREELFDYARWCQEMVDVTPINLLTAGAFAEPEKTSALQMATKAQSSTADVTRIVAFITEGSTVRRMFAHTGEATQPEPE